MQNNKIETKKNFDDDERKKEETQGMPRKLLPEESPIANQNDAFDACYSAVFARLER
jgi:hypothetical protein